jgi:hypothetical protein
MMEDIVVADDQEIALLEKWLPVINAQERAYLKGATEALLYAQEGSDAPCSCLRSRELLGDKRSGMCHVEN